MAVLPFQMKRSSSGRGLGSSVLDGSLQKKQYPMLISTHVPHLILIGQADIYSFYKYHSPLTPISLPAFDSHAAYSNLVKDEPILTVTVLTIASRYMELSGPGGKTRSFMIHERLWSYLQNMITRMFWGQEQFGGGFCGAGTRGSGQTSPGKGELRTLGTIERYVI